MNTPAQLFVSYAHADEQFRIDLEKHLSLLKREQVLSIWHDRLILPGENIDAAIHCELVNSKLVLLLVSADFLSSDYCYTKEMTQALQQHAEGRSRVVPIIVRACEWHHAPIGALLALPRDGRPINVWPDRDEAFSCVAREIRRLLTWSEMKRQQREPLLQADPSTATERWRDFRLLPNEYGGAHDVADITAERLQARQFFGCGPYLARWRKWRQLCQGTALGLAQFRGCRPHAEGWGRRR